MTAPGTYTGADGREYRWVHEWLDDSSGSGYDHQVFCSEWTQEWIDPADIDVAKAALDALVEAESEEWVEFPREGNHAPFRFNLELTRLQFLQDQGSGQWREAEYDLCLIRAAYRKGREQAQQEAQDELDAKTREITTLRAVCASINILMQERGLEGMGGKNYALLFGVVQTYINQLEAPLVESAVLRDAARELVEVVKDMPTFNQVDCWDWLKAVKAAAKALEGKL